MEEKERFEYIHNDEIGDGILDIKTKNEIYDIEQMSNLLNQQDKEIKHITKLYYELNNKYCKELDKLINMQEENGYIIFSDGYDENGNEVHKQEFVKYKDKFNELVEENKKLKQSQKQLAISELEKVKTKFNSKRPIDELASEVGIELGYTSTQINNFVENKIKELKGEKPTIKCSLCGKEMVKLADGVNYCCNYCHTQTLLNVLDIGEE